MACCIKFSLVIFSILNIFQIFAGFALIIGGLLLLFRPAILDPLHEQQHMDLYKGVAEAMKFATDPNYRKFADSCYAESWAPQSGGILTINWMEIELSFLLLIIFIIIGAIFVGQSLWGFISLAKCCHKAFLILYAISTTFLMIFFPIAYLLCYTDPIHEMIIDAIGESLQKSMKTTYGFYADNTCSSFKLAFDAIQYLGNCCGVYGYDFEDDRSLYYSHTCWLNVTAGVHPLLQSNGCLYFIRHYLVGDFKIYLGIVCGGIGLIMLIDTILAIVLIGLWHRKTPIYDDDDSEKSGSGSSSSSSSSSVDSDD